MGAAWADGQKPVCPSRPWEVAWLPFELLLMVMALCQLSRYLLVFFAIFGYFWFLGCIFGLGRPFERLCDCLARSWWLWLCASCQSLLWQSPIMSQASQRLAQLERIVGMELKPPWNEWKGRCFMIRPLRLCMHWCGNNLCFWAKVTLNNLSGAEPLIKICMCGLDVKSSYYIVKHRVVAEISYPMKVLRFITRVSKRCLFSNNNKISTSIGN